MKTTIGKTRRKALDRYAATGESPQELARRCPGAGAETIENWIVKARAYGLQAVAIGDEKAAARTGRL